MENIFLCEAWNENGNELYNLQKYERAIKSYDKTIEVNGISENLKIEMFSTTIIKNF